MRLGAALTIFAFALTAAPVLAEPERAPQGPTAPPAAETGAGLFKASGCGACHSSGGIVLSGMDARETAEFEAIFLTPPTGMPVFRFSPDELAAISEYLRAAHR